MDDFNLIRKCLDGNKPAWDMLVDRFSALIYDAILRTLRKYGCRQENNLVADLHHDVFVALLEDKCRALRLFEARNGCQLAHYIRTIAARKTIDHLRKSCVMFSLDEEPSGENGYGARLVRELISSDGPSPLEEQEALEMAHRLLAELKEDERAFCAMIYKEGKNPMAIAGEMGISVAHFYVRKGRLLDKLRAIAAAKKFLTL